MGLGANTAHGASSSSTQREHSRTQTAAPFEIGGQRRYDVGIGGEIASIIESSHGGHLLCGTVYTDRNPRRATGSGFLLKIDTNGIVEWTHRYGGDDADEIHAIAETSDGDYIFAGQTDSDVPVTSAWLGKVAPDGTPIWQHTYGGERADSANAVVTTADGYLFAGTTRSSGDGPSSGWVVSVDSSGTEQWHRTYDEGAGEESLTAMHATDDGTYLLAGLARSGGPRTRDGWLVHIDADGAERWTQTYGGSRSDEIETVIEASDGGFVFGGNSRSTGGRGRDAWIVKVDTDGETIWQHTYQHSRFQSLNALLETAAGTYLMVCQSVSTGGGSTTRAVELQETPAGVTTTWDTSVSHGSDTDALWTATQTSDGEIYLGGCTWSNDTNWQQPWLVRFGERERLDFDPRVDAFGFTNWSGDTGPIVTGGEFDLELDVPPHQEIQQLLTAHWESVDDSVTADVLARIVHAELSLQQTSNGHALGMVHAAADYHTTPERLPDGSQTASEITQPTDAYEDVGEDIRDYQAAQLIETEFTLARQAAGFGQLDAATQLSLIERALEFRSAVPVMLCRESGSPSQDSYHQVLAYGMRTVEGDVELDVYDPEHPARAYDSGSTTSGYEEDGPRQVMRISAETGELIEYEDYDSYGYLDLYSTTQADWRSDERATNADPFENVFFVGVSGPARVRVEAADGTPVRAPAQRTTSPSGTRYNDAVWLFDGDPGEYRIEVVGDATGDYTLETVAVLDGELVYKTDFEETIDTGYTHGYVAPLPESLESPPEGETAEGTPEPTAKSRPGLSDSLPDGVDRETFIERSKENLPILGSIGAASLGLGIVYKYR